MLVNGQRIRAEVKPADGNGEAEEDDYDEEEEEEPCFVCGGYGTFLGIKDMFNDVANV